MTKEFMREERYIVFKVSDLGNSLKGDEIRRLAQEYAEQRRLKGKEPLECVVVEKDWPEYEPTWRAIEARVAGAQAQSAPSVPDGWKEAAIAWEVCASIHREYGKGKDPFFNTRQGDFVKHANDARAMLAALAKSAEKEGDALRARIEAIKPVAWLDDGTCREGSEATAHRVVTNETKRDMPASVAASFSVPLGVLPGAKGE